MVQITASSVLGFDYNNIEFSKLLGDVDYVSSKKLFSVTYENGFVDEFRGKHFSYNHAGLPNDGIVKNWFEFVGEDPYASFRGLNISAADITRAARTADTTDDHNLVTRALRGADSFVGSDGNDTINLFGGNDTIDGGGGSDFLIGGRGADTFVFGDVTDSPKADLDQIADFSQEEGDKIDLSGIDANGATDGDQAFTFIGAVAFSKTAGELRAVYNEATDTTRVGVDIDGDGAGDFEIALLGEYTLTADDFTL